MTESEEKLNNTEELESSEWFVRASAFYTKKNWREMLNWCWQWAESEPEKAEAWNGLWVALSKLNYYDELPDVYRQMLEADPKYAIAWNSLARASVGFGIPEEATDAYKELNIGPREIAIAWYALGKQYEKYDRNEDAAAAYRRSHDIDPNRTATWNNPRRTSLYSIIQSMLNRKLQKLNLHKRRTVLK
jgi:tetratricopeptide (TPR) repeat protein